MWSFTASAAQGWVFDHWEMGYSYQDVDPAGESGVFTSSSSSNPWSSGGFLKEGTDEWDDTFWESLSAGYRHGWRTITALVAVFRRSHQPTHLILHSPTNNQILHGASGTILTDD